MELPKPVDRKILNLAFIGLGWIGKNRMDAIIKSGLAVPALLSDSNPELLNQLSLVYPGSIISEKMDRDDIIDGAVIATPNAFHASQAIQIMNAGIPVFCQKPLARTTEETKKIVNKAKDMNLFLGVDFSYRYTAAFKKVLEIVKSGEIGDIYSVDLVFHNAFGPGKSWCYDPMLSGGGCVIDLGIHLIDLLLYTLNSPEVQEVTAYLYNKGKVIQEEKMVEDYALVLISFQNGISAKLTCSWNLSIGQDADIEAAFYGSKGTSVFKNLSGSFYDFNAELYKGNKKETLISPPDDWMGKAGIYWAERIMKDTSYDNSADSYIKTARIIDQIYRRL
jgi:predicted dehydrogenase